jgi:hypothetical protein
MLIYYGWSRQIDLRNARVFRHTSEGVEKCGCGQNNVLALIRFSNILLY